ncbi:MAG: EAL and modified HD-GYP domain-containing signal transduction protein [Gammaproteobacteria bacterium]
MELLETLVIDDALIEGCRARKQQGYMLALDDFVYSEKWEPLIELADIIKIDVLDVPDTEVAALVNRLKNRGVTLLAEKVETLEQYETLRDWGFHYFQGYFLSRPEVVEGRRVEASSMATLQLLGELQKPSILPEELEQLISCDVNLSYKLLRFVNSPALGLPREVDSLRHAVVLIGLSALKHWVALIALTAGTQPPAEVTKNALTRARMCELLATASGEQSPSTFFMVGLLSSLEHFLHIPLPTALEVLSLNEECEAALLSHTGPMGKALTCAMAYEICDWDTTRFSGLAPGEITTAFANASEWAMQSYAEMISK